MPRPCKRRRICEMPACEGFGPKGVLTGERKTLTMTLDEYECIRLIDFEGLTQEQCAAQMRVARSTAQSIYYSARLKLAECLVNLRELRISGGDYVLCDESPESCGCPRQCGRRCRLNEFNMEENK